MSLCLLIGELSVWQDQWVKEEAVSQLTARYVRVTGSRVFAMVVGRVVRFGIYFGYSTSRSCYNELDMRPEREREIKKGLMICEQKIFLVKIKNSELLAWLGGLLGLFHWLIHSFLCKYEVPWYTQHYTHELFPEVASSVGSNPLNQKERKWMGWISEWFFTFQSDVQKCHIHLESFLNIRGRTKIKISPHRNVFFTILVYYSLSRKSKHCSDVCYEFEKTWYSLNNLF